MHGFKRWMLMAPLALWVIGLAGANDDPAGPDTVHAEAAVAEAQTAVKFAQAQQALWTSAEEALRKAIRALREGNYAVAVEQARLAQQQAGLGIAQKSYPLFR